MAKILSKNINVYPTGFRGLNADLKPNGDGVAFDPESIYNTEDNLTRPYKFIAGGNYVITNTYSAGEEFKIILGGYYFNIRKFNIPDDLKDKSELFAHIKIEPKGNPQDDDDNTRYTANALRPLDVSNVDDLDSKQSGEYYFDGLIIDDNGNNANYSETLLILKKSGGSWIVPEESKLRFSPKHVEGGTDYNTHDKVGLDKQLDTKLIYSPNGDLTLQGKDKVEVKSVDSSADAAVNTIWNTSEESITSKGKKIEATINESSEKGYNTKMSLDKDAIVLSKQASNSSLVLGKEAIFELKDEFSHLCVVKGENIRGQAKTDIELKPNQMTLKAVSTTSKSSVVLDNTAGVTIEASGAAKGVTINSSVGSASLIMDSSGVALKTSAANKEIQVIGSASSSPITIETQSTNSPIKLLTAGSDLVFNAKNSGSSIAAYIGDTESSSTSKVKLSPSSISVVHGSNGINIGTSTANYLSVGKTDANNNVIISPQDSGTSIALGTSSSFFKECYIENINGHTVSVVVPASCSSKAVYIDNTKAKSNGAVWVDLSSAESNNYGLIVAGGGTSTKISPVCVVTQSYYATSDRRLKENIKSFNYSKAITDIEVKEFNFKGDKNKTIGIIAQDLQEIYPELVHENENGYLSVQEDKLIYLLLEEVKQLKKEVTELKNIKK